MALKGFIATRTSRFSFFITFACGVAFDEQMLMDAYSPPVQGIDPALPQSLSVVAQVQHMQQQQQQAQWQMQQQQQQQHEQQLAQQREQQQQQQPRSPERRPSDTARLNGLQVWRATPHQDLLLSLDPVRMVDSLVQPTASELKAWRHTLACVLDVRGKHVWLIGNDGTEAVMLSATSQEQQPAPMDVDEGQAKRTLSHWSAEEKEAFFACFKVRRAGPHP